MPDPHIQKVISDFVDGPGKATSGGMWMLIEHIGKLEEGLKKAAARFREYEEHHRAKGTGGIEKANRNARIAEELEDLIRKE